MTETTLQLIGRTIGTWVTLLIGIILGASNADILPASPVKFSLLFVLLACADLTVRLLARRYTAKHERS